MRAFLVVPMVLFLTACTAKFAGELQVDGTAFKPVQCRSGQALGFSGVQFTDAGGRRLRLVANIDGTANAGLFAPNAAGGGNLGTCGTLNIQAQNSSINHTRNLKGAADLSCEAMGHKVVGHLQFENCH